MYEPEPVGKQLRRERVADPAAQARDPIFQRLQQLTSAQVLIGLTNFIFG